MAWVIVGVGAAHGSAQCSTSNIGERREKCRSKLWTLRVHLSRWRRQRFHGMSNRARAFRALGQLVIVENRGAGLLVREFMSKALPDGYTLSVNGGIAKDSPRTLLMKK